MVSNLFSHRSTKIFLFTLTLLFTYLLLFLVSQQLQFPPIWDEKRFWQVSLSFSHHLLPNLQQIQNYSELNTPLPFILFGWLEYWFHQGIAAGRFFNLFLSFILAFLIGCPAQRKAKNSILAVIGLLVFPYYLWLSTHLYTDIIAVFFGFFGVWFYLKNQHGFSSLAFILAIASRQFMLAFPVGILIYEIATVIRSRFLNSDQPASNPSISGNNITGSMPASITRQVIKRWVSLLVAIFSIFGWIWLFNGLAPSSALEQRAAPSVQYSLWAISPSSSLYFLGCVGLYFVIPEWILFSRQLSFKSWCTAKNISLAIGLLLLTIAFPLPDAHGILAKTQNILPGLVFHSLVYGLGLLTCIRFNRINLASCLLLANMGLMLKAYPWDKYVLPLLVVLWYFKSIQTLDKS